RGKSMEGDLDWVKKMVEGMMIETGDVVFIPKKGGAFIKSLEPINNKYQDADIMAVDDVLKDDAPESDSEVGAIVWRRTLSLDKIGRVPVMTYLGRHKKREKNFDDMLKMAVYNNCRMAVEDIDDGLIDYFLKTKKVNGRLYLKRNPYRNGKLVNERDAYGYSVKEAEKLNGKAKMIEWVNGHWIDSVTDIRF